MTLSTEYHFRRDQCVAVRDRETREWMEEHRALRRRLAGALQFKDGDAKLVDRPEIGDRLVFAGGNFMTSIVIAVERPPREIVARYDAPRSSAQSTS